MTKRFPFYLAWALVGLLLSCGSAHAQTPVIGSEKVQFDQQASSLAEAQGYVYRLVIDGVRNAAPVTVTCSGTASPFVCQTSGFPALTPGAHTIALTAASLVNGVEAESAPSVALPIIVVVAPGIPQNLRIVR